MEGGDNEHKNLRERIVAILRCVPTPTDNFQGLNLLLSSLEVCLINDRTLFIAPPQCCQLERRQSCKFTVWLLVQLCAEYGKVAQQDKTTSDRVREFVFSLLRTIQARDLSLLNGLVFQVWLRSLQQLTSHGYIEFRLPVEDQVLDKKVIFSHDECSHNIGLLLSANVVSLFALDNGQVRSLAACLSRAVIPAKCQQIFCSVTSRLTALSPGLTSMPGFRPSLRKCLLTPPDIYHAEPPDGANKTAGKTATADWLTDKISPADWLTDNVAPADWLADKILSADWRNAGDVITERSAEILSLTLDEKAKLLSQLLGRFLRLMSDCVSTADLTSLYTASVSAIEKFINASSIDGTTPASQSVCSLAVAVVSMVWVDLSSADLTWHDLVVGAMYDDSLQQLKQLSPRLAVLCFRGDPLSDVARPPSRCNFPPSVLAAHSFNVLCGMTHVVCPEWRRYVVHRALPVFAAVCSDCQSSAKVEWRETASDYFRSLISNLPIFSALMLSGDESAFVDSITEAITLFTRHRSYFSSVFGRHAATRSGDVVSGNAATVFTANIDVCSVNGTVNGDGVSSGPDSRLLLSLVQTVCLLSGHAFYKRDVRYLKKFSVGCDMCQPWLSPSDDPPRQRSTTLAEQNIGRLINVLVELSVSARTWWPVVACLNHTDQRIPIIEHILQAELIDDWSPLFRQIISADSDWLVLQTAFCDWLIQTVKLDPGSEKLAAFTLDVFARYHPGKSSGFQLNSSFSKRMSASCEIVRRICQLLSYQLVSEQASTLTVALAQRAVASVSKRCGYTPASLFHLHKHTIYRTAARITVENGWSLTCLAPLAAAWEFRQLIVMLRRGLQYLLPVFVTYMAEGDSGGVGHHDYLASLSSLLKSKRKDLLIDHYACILAHVMDCDQREDLLPKVHLLLSSAIGVSIDDIRRCSIQNQINELLSKLHSHRDHVLTELSYLAVLDGQSSRSVPAKNLTLDELNQFLSPRVLGVLGWVDTQFSSRSFSVDDKLQLLQSIGELCKLLGPKYLSSVGRKVLATIRSGIDSVTRYVGSSAMDDICVGLWTNLARSLSGDILTTTAAEIIVSLQTLSPAARLPTLRCILIERRSELGDTWCDLLELVTGWQQLPADLELEGHSGGSCSSVDSLCDRVARIRRLLVASSGGGSLLRNHILSVLYTVLDSSRIQLLQLTTSRGQCVKHVLPILRVLLSAARVAESDCLRLIASCVGAIGAIDPMLVSSSSSSSSSSFVTGGSPGGAASPAPSTSTLSDRGSVESNQSEYCSPEWRLVAGAVDSPSFCLRLLSQLVSVYTSDQQPQTQACAAFAMQEILKVFNLGGSSVVSSAPGEVPGGVPRSTAAAQRLWEAFPARVRQVLAPMRCSQYQLTSTTAAPEVRTATQPLLQTTVAKTTPDPACEISSSASGDLLRKQQQLLQTNGGVSSHTAASPATAVYKPGSMSFADWLGQWLSKLISYVSSHQAALVFAATQPILARSSSLAAFLLPHVFVCSVIDGQPSARADIVAEMSAVWCDVVNTDPLSSLEGKNCSVLCCDQLLAAVDALDSWQQHQLVSCGMDQRKLTALREESAQYISVVELQKQIPYDMMAEACVACGAHRRALQSMELHIRRHPSQLNNKLSFLQDMYVCLSEPDGVAGIAATRCSGPTVHDQLLLSKSLGNTQHALSCYELLSASNDNQLVGYRGLLSCYLNLDQPNTALSVTRDLIGRDSKWEEPLGHFLVEAAWRLGRWDILQEALDVASPTNWSCIVGHSLLNANESNKEAVEKYVTIGRLHEMAVWSSVSSDSGTYSRFYPHIVRLHSLTDAELCLSILTSSTIDDDTVSRLNDVISGWRSRLQTVQPNVTNLQPLLTVQRACLTLARDKISKFGHNSAECFLNGEISRSWLHSAQLSRRHGHLEHATNCLLHMEAVWSECATTSAAVVPTASSGNTGGYERQRALSALFVERAGLLWLSGARVAAIRQLKQGIERHYSDWQTRVKEGTMSEEERVLLAEAKLNLARYCEQAATVDTSVIRQHYVDTAEIRRNWEDAHFHMAKYLDRLSSSLPLASQDSSIGLRVMHAFGKSLQCGCKHVYESMPRLLSIWLDADTSARGNKGVSARDRTSNALLSQQTTVSHKTLEMMNKLVGQLCDRLPLYCFLTSLPQIVSRICHTNRDIYAHIRVILAKLLARYPQQCVWYMLAVSKSSYPMRVERCLDVFGAARTEKPELAKFIADATRLADKLIDLSNKPVDKKQGTKVSMSSFFPSIRRLVSDDFSSILLPLQQQMTVNLPEGVASHDGSHHPFSLQPVCIAGFDDEIEVMTSLVKPKKITIRGTDGFGYTMMAKPKDDLRKDSRLMEFNGLVNRLLSADDEARTRNLRIRTYSVVPLNEECGLVEWVPHLTGLRQILLLLYKQLATPMSLAEVRKCLPALEDPLPAKRAVFVDKILPRHPPVLHRWFLVKFSEPQTWYSARLSYARTTAVMSMIGYILGLGDRHGENILLDSACGDCVHVDFNCLFNKGEQLEWAERVPFRLTHNLVDAMGPTGVEGVYRTACEVTMNLMRQQCEALMCVLRPFLYDPLVEWSKPERHTRHIAEIVNEKAQGHVGDIEQRLMGQVRSRLKPIPIPLSVPGQVNYLIDEATSIDNLCQMYIGWSAYF